MLVVVVVVVAVISCVAIVGFIAEYDERVEVEDIPRNSLC